MRDKEIFEQLTEYKEHEVPVCLATIVQAEGSTPRKVGTKMLVCEDGKTFGSVGGGRGENQVHSASLLCLLSDKKPSVIAVDLTDDLGVKGGDVCGGKMLIFIEPYL